jgi:cytochrome P450
VISVVKAGEPITYNHIKRMKYLKATVKESMRLTPSASGLVRTFDYPIAIGGYEIPPKIGIVTMGYVSATDSSEFSNPEVKGYSFTLTDRN